MRRKLLLSVVILVPLASTATAKHWPAELSASTCFKIEAREWWQKEADGSLSDFQERSGERLARWGDEVCFRANLKELLAPGLRVKAYQDVLQNLRRQLSGYDVSQLPPPPSQPVNPVLHRAFPALLWKDLQDLAGRRFASIEEFDAWYESNRRFMTWSEESGRLVVDDAAKREGRVLVSNLIESMSGQQFWFWKATDALKIDREMDGYLEGSLTLQGSTWPFRIPQAVLEDREGKRLGLIDALDDRLKGDLKGNLGSDLVRELEQLAHQTRRDAAAWRKWWSLNKQRLKLSADGTHLVLE